MKKFTLIIGSILMSLLSFSQNVIDTNLATSTLIYLDQTGEANLSLNPLHFNAATDSVHFLPEKFYCADINANKKLYITIFDTSGANTQLIYSDSTVADVKDTSAPALQLASSFNLYLNEFGADTLKFSDIDLGSTDNCALNITGFKVLSKTIFECSDTGTANYTMTMPDYHGNLATETISITVLDTVRPQLALQNDTVYLSGVSLQGYLFASNLMSNASDNCSIDFLQVNGANQLAFGCADVGANTVAVSAFDGAGNQSTAQMTVYVLDTTSPSYTKTSYQATLLLGQATMSRSDILQNVSGGCTVPQISILSDTVFSCNDVKNNPNYIHFSITNGAVTIFDSAAVTVVDLTPISYVKVPFTASLVADFVAVSRDDILIIPPVGCTRKALEFLSDTVFDCDAAQSNPNYIKFKINNGLTTVVDSVPVNVEDNVFPVLNLKSDTLVINAGTALLSFGNVDDGSFDNCNLDSISINGLASINYSCADIGQHKVEIYIADASGNFQADSVEIFVADTAGPTYTKTSHTAYLQGDSVRVARNKILKNVAGGCSVATVSILSDTTFYCYDIANNPSYIKFSATSGGKTIVDSVAVNVQDITPPTLVLKTDTLFLNGAGSQATLTFAQLNNGSNDNCALDSATLNGLGKIDFGCADTGKHKIVVVLFDQRGNASEDSLFVWVADTAAPTFSKTPATVYLNQNSATISRADVLSNVTGGCFAPSIVFLSDTTFSCASTACNPIYVKFEVTNGLKTVTDSVAISVVDSTAPQVLLKSDTLILQNGQAALNFAQINNGTFDNCSIDSATVNGFSTQLFSCADTGLVQVICKVWDVSGNMSQDTTNVYIADTISPSYSKMNVTRYLQNSPVSVSRNDIISNATAGCFPPVFAFLSDTIFDCNATSTNPNWIKFSFTSASETTVDSAAIYVLDTVNPFIALQPDTLILVNNVAQLQFADVDDGSFDYCGIDSVTYNGLSQKLFNCSDSGAHKIEVRIFDASGNWNADSVEIYVADTIQPTYTKTNIVAPLSWNQVQVARADYLSNVVAGCYTPTVSVLSDTTFTCTDILSNPHIIKFQITSASGVLVDSVEVTVADTTKPYLNVKSDTLYFSNGNLDVSFSDFNSGSIDNCNLGNGFVNGQGTFTINCAQGGINKLEVSVADASGNLAKDSLTIYVMDSVLPTYTKTPHTAYYVNSDIVISKNDLIQNINGGCSAPFFEFLSDTIFDCSAILTNPNYVKFQFSNGISSIVDSVAVTILDTIQPTLSIKPPQIFNLNANGEYLLTPQDLLVNAGTDNCAIDSIQIIPAKLTCNNTQNYATVVVTAYDLSGNFTTVSTLAIAQDLFAPTIVPATDTVYLDSANGMANITIYNATDTVFDNCQLNGFNVSQTQFSCSDIGANIVVVNATDAAGNNSQANATIWVLDTTRPYHQVYNSAQVYLDANGQATLKPSDVFFGTSFDNCGIVDTTYSQINFDCADEGNGPKIELITKDASGNERMDSIQIYVNDTVRPVGVGQNGTFAIDTATGQVQLTPWQLLASASDNCAIDSSLSQVNPAFFDCNNIGTNSANVFIVDIHGNVRVINVAVTIEGATISGSEIEGEMETCANGFNVKYAVQTPRSSSNYIWEVTNGSIVSTAFKGREIYVHWNKNAAQGTLKLKEQNPFNCGEVETDTTVVFSGIALDTSRIVYWSNATKNTLVSTDTEAQMFQWGYDQVQNGNLNSYTIPGQTSNSYYNQGLTQNIDVYGFRYWCETSIDGLCWTRSYFQNSYPVSLEENQLAKTEIYPNPFAEDFRISSNLELKNVRITSLEGRVVLMENEIRKKELKIKANNTLKAGAYILQIEYLNGTVSQHKIIRIQ